ncbi:MAG TPA: hypothetical protein VFQ79_05185 [Bryobacteraceae bacterium]|nr:hypothetical protein [Bryobacteraceae bacterium]
MEGAIDGRRLRHARQDPAGRNQVDFGKGGFVILGFVKPGSGVEAGLQGRRLSRNRGDLDWLFEEE